MQTIRWRIRAPSSSLLKIVLIVAGAWMSLGVLQQFPLAHPDPDYLWKPWEESMDSKMYRPPANPVVNHAVIKNDTDFPDWDPTHLQKLLESPTTTCRHLVSLGGTFYCGNCQTCKMDGNKYICFDNDVRPVPGDCLIYSFGVGGEITWDRAMLKFNCSIYAFDMTTEWDNGVVGHGFHFLNVGLDQVNYDAYLNMTNADEENPAFKAKMGFFRTLSTIRDILGHKERPIDILKLDIEFTEWNVFEGIFNSTENSEVLDDVKQIALEIHLDDFKKPSAAERVAGGRRVEKILQDLFERGFHMAHTELNSAMQVYAEVRGQVVPLFRESLFLHRP